MSEDAVCYLFGGSRLCGERRDWFPSKIYLTVSTKASIRNLFDSLTFSAASRHNCEEHTVVAMTLYVQFGSSTDCPPGWRNFDPSIYLKLGRLPLLGRMVRPWLPHQFPPGVEVGDVVKGLPIANSEADVVFCSHVLEHLAYEDALVALGEVYRILKPGGLFRVVVPDLESRVREYVNNYDRLETPGHTLMRATLLGRSKPKSGSLSAIMKCWLSTSQHEWMWDYRSLRVELVAQGFSSVRRFEFCESEDARLRAAEKESRFFWSPADWHSSSEAEKPDRIAELAVEATK